EHHVWFFSTQDPDRFPDVAQRADGLREQPVAGQRRRADDVFRAHDVLRIPVNQPALGARVDEHELERPLHLLDDFLHFEVETATAQAEHADTQWRRAGSGRRTWRRDLGHFSFSLGRVLARGRASWRAASARAWRGLLTSAATSTIDTVVPFAWRPDDRA